MQVDAIAFQHVAFYAVVLRSEFAEAVYQDAGRRVTAHPVARDQILGAAADHDPLAESATSLGGRGGVPVVNDKVPDHKSLGLGRQLLHFLRIRGDADAVVAEGGPHHVHAARRVGSLVANGVPLGNVVGDQRVAGFALPHIEAAVGMAADVGMIDLTTTTSEGVDAVQAVVVGSDVRDAIPLDGVAP